MNSDINWKMRQLIPFNDEKTAKNFNETWSLNASKTASLSRALNLDNPKAIACVSPTGLPTLRRAGGFYRPTVAINTSL